jgi:hypothetical protein
VRLEIAMANNPSRRNLEIQIVASGTVGYKAVPRCPLQQIYNLVFRRQNKSLVLLRLLFNTRVQYLNAW